MLWAGLIGGFLGAGKTTTMLAVARQLEAQGRRVAVVVNDQGDRLVDGRLARAALPGAAVGEVTGGCFCCRFDELAGTIARLVHEREVDAVLAEAVGSCADLQATVVRPLRTRFPGRIRVAPLLTVVEPARLEAFGRRPRSAAEADLAYLFERQLAEADVIALSKADTRPADEVSALEAQLGRSFSRARVVGYSALREPDVARLLDAWGRPAALATDLELDYGRYGSAEARLGWFNADVELAAAGPEGLDPAGWSDALLSEISGAAERGRHAIGHVKLAVDTPEGMVAGSLVAAGDVPRAHGGHGRVTECSAVFNARMACSPQALDALVRRALEHADRAAGARSRLAGARAFAPSFPRPTHRVPAANAAAQTTEVAR